MAAPAGWPGARPDCEPAPPGAGVTGAPEPGAPGELPAPGPPGVLAAPGTPPGEAAPVRPEGRAVRALGSAGVEIEESDRAPSGSRSIPTPTAVPPTTTAV